MINVIHENDNWTFKFDNKELSNEFLIMLFKKAEIENLLEGSEINSTNAFELSEEIKENWWEMNKDRIFYKAGLNNAGCC